MQKTSKPQEGFDVERSSENTFRFKCSLWRWQATARKQQYLDTSRGAEASVPWSFALVRLFTVWLGQAVPHHFEQHRADAPEKSFIPSVALARLCCHAPRIPSPGAAPTITTLRLATSTSLLRVCLTLLSTLVRGRWGGETHNSGLFLLGGCSPRPEGTSSKPTPFSLQKPIICCRQEASNGTHIRDEQRGGKEGWGGGSGTGDRGGKIE